VTDKALIVYSKRPGRVALAFDFAGITKIMGAPSFPFFAKGGTRKSLRMWVNSIAT
jgi:hypothetical protein